MREVFGRVRETVRVRLAEWASAVPDRVDGDPEEWATRVGPVLIGAVPGFMIQREIAADFDEEAYLRALPEVFPH